MKQRPRWQRHILLIAALYIMFLPQQQRAVVAFSSRSTFLAGSRTSKRNQRSLLFDNSRTGGHQNKNIMTMRDASASYWFQVGDRVQVVDDVYVQANSVNLRDQVGTVVEVWEKCDVDPTCCCAEQVDPGMAVRVEFDVDGGGDRSMHYFAEEELWKVSSNDKDGENVENEEKKTTMDLPFDGLSCTAFKMDQLNNASQSSRQIGSLYDPSSQSSGNGQQE